MADGVCPAGMGKSWAGGSSITANRTAMVAQTHTHKKFLTTIV